MLILTTIRISMIYLELSGVPDRIWLWASFTTSISKWMPNSQQGIRQCRMGDSEEMRMASTDAAALHTAKSLFPSVQLVGTTCFRTGSRQKSPTCSHTLPHSLLFMHHVYPFSDHIPGFSPHFQS